MGGHYRSGELEATGIRILGGGGIDGVVPSLILIYLYFRVTAQKRSTTTALQYVNMLMCWVLIMSMFSVIPLFPSNPFGPSGWEQIPRG